LKALERKNKNGRKPSWYRGKKKKVRVSGEKTQLIEPWIRYQDLRRFGSKAREERPEKDVSNVGDWGIAGSLALRGTGEGSHDAVTRRKEKN